VADLPLDLVDDIDLHHCLEVWRRRGPDHLEEDQVHGAAEGEESKLDWTQRNPDHGKA
jgi:hypothetical protein